MKHKSFIAIAFILLLSVTASSCAGHKDCQGKRHRVKTEMGGWL